MGIVYISYLGVIFIAAEESRLTLSQSLSLKWILARLFRRIALCGSRSKALSYSFNAWEYCLAWYLASPSLLKEHALAIYTTLNCRYIIYIDQAGKASTCARCAQCMHVCTTHIKCAFISLLSPPNNKPKFAWRLLHSRLHSRLNVYYCTNCNMSMIKMKNIDTILLVLTEIG